MINLSSLNKGLVGHWRISADHTKNANNDIADLTPYGNTAVNTNVTFGTDRHGQSNQAGVFNGAGYLVSSFKPISVVGSMNPLSVSFWIKGYSSTGKIIGSEQTGGDLIITSVFDGPLTGGLPKGIELYVVNNISDLSVYGVGSANSGNGTDGQEFTFPADAASSGDYLYITYQPIQFETWFGFAPNYASPSMIINGDDAIELYYNGVVTDLFGDVNTDGTGEDWEYLDGWTYSNDDRSASSTFNSADWVYSRKNALDGETTNATSSNPIPVGTYQNTFGTNDRFYVWSESTDEIRVGLGGLSITTSSLDYDVANWTNLSFSFNGTEVLVYMNGVYNQTLPGYGAGSFMDDVMAIGGSNLGVNIFIGSIDDVRIYNRALTALEITKLYNQYKSQLRIS